MKAIGKTGRSRCSLDLPIQAVSSYETFISNLNSKAIEHKPKIIERRNRNVDIMHNNVCIAHIDKDGININTDYAEFGHIIKNNINVIEIQKFIKQLK